MSKLKITVITITATVLLTIAAVVYFESQETPEVSTASALMDFVSNNGYEAFPIPRNKWGVGTVISFNKKTGNENIERHNDECLKLTSPEVDEAEASLATSSYRMSRNANVEFSLAKGIASGVDLSAGLEDTRVDGIDITITAPRERLVSQGKLTDRIIQVTEEGNTCTDKIFEDGYYVIDRVLAVEGFSFTFKSKRGNTITMDTTLMDAIKLAPELRQKFEGNGSLASSKSRIIGYQLFDMNIKPGLAEGGIEAIRVNPAELKRRILTEN
jgi:hypothetical protein